LTTPLFLFIFILFPTSRLITFPLSKKRGHYKYTKKGIPCTKLINPLSPSCGIGKVKKKSVTVGDTERNSI